MIQNTLNNILYIIFFIILHSCHSSDEKTYFFEITPEPLESDTYKKPELVFYGRIKKINHKCYKAHRDKEGNIIKKGLYDQKSSRFGKPKQYRFDSIGRQTLYLFNNNFNKNHLNTGILYKYNKKGNISEISEVSYSEKLDSFKRKTSSKYFYNNKNKISEIAWSQEVLDENNNYNEVVKTYNRQVYSYNDQGIPIRYREYTNDFFEKEKLELNKDISRIFIEYEYSKDKIAKKKNIEIDDDECIFLYEYYDNGNLQSEHKFYKERPKNYYRKVQFYDNGIIRKMEVFSPYTNIGHEFSEYKETGDIIKINNKQIAKYLEYDELGNWTHAIFVDERSNFKDEDINLSTLDVLNLIYVERQIEYYE